LHIVEFCCRGAVGSFWQIFDFGSNPFWLEQGLQWVVLARHELLLFAS